MRTKEGKPFHFKICMYVCACTYQKFEVYIWGWVGARLKTQYKVRMGQGAWKHVEKGIDGISFMHACMYNTVEDNL